MKLRTDTGITHYDEYYHMVNQWKDIMLLPISKEEKSERCVKIIQEHIRQLARRHVHDPNPMLRFYADMLVLYSDARPKMGGVDSFFEVAISPIYWAVREAMELIPEQLEPTVHLPITGSRQNQTVAQTL